MAKDKNAKKGKKRRVDKAKIKHYWEVRHVPNMLRRAMRVLTNYGRVQANLFVKAHSENCAACSLALEIKFLRALS
jgi:hypothetical protein